VESYGRVCGKETGRREGIGGKENWGEGGKHVTRGKIGAEGEQGKRRGKKARTGGLKCDGRVK